MKKFREFLAYLGALLTTAGGFFYVLEGRPIYKALFIWLSVPGLIILTLVLLLYLYEWVLHRSAADEPRSCIALTKATLRKAIATGDYPIADLRINNIGQIPAFNLRITLGSTLLGGRERKKAKKGVLPKAEAVSFDRGLDLKGGELVQFDSSLPSDPKTLSASEITSIEQDVQTFYIWGEIFYDDMSRKDRSSKFCAFTNDTTDTQLALCSKGNQTN
jgi:hypothetical protein